MDARVASEVLVFAGLRFDRRGGRLFRQDPNGAWLAVKLGSRAIAVLEVLLDHPGALVSKDTIMDAVSPRCVEPNNLTVQITALRRILDGRAGGSCIQTVPGRGYRFLTAVTKLKENDENGSVGKIYPTQDQHISAASIHGPGTKSQAPRLSFMVLPFANLGSNSNDDHLAAAITEDLTTDLCRLDCALVVADSVGSANCSRPLDAREINQTLSVRYIVIGSIRKSDQVVRVNVHLLVAETNTYLWAGRFDFNLTDALHGRDGAVSRIKAELAVQLLGVGSSRSVQERPDNPDAIDLVLRARSLLRRDDHTGTLRDVSLLLQQALRLDPSCVAAMCQLAGVLISRFVNNGDDLDDHDVLDQAMAVVTTAATIAPNDERVMHYQGYLARALGRWTEAIATLQRLVVHFPHTSMGFRQLGFCKLAIGQPEAAIPLLERSIYLDPLPPWNRYAHLRLSQAHVLLGNDGEAIECAQRAMAEGPADAPDERAYCYRLMASAYALKGQRDAAHRALAEAAHHYPFATVRTQLSSLSARGLPDPTYVAQLSRMWQGLRIVGMRDHAVEDADFGVTSHGTWYRERSGFTPSTVPGATTIGTSTLAALLSRQQLLLIDTAASTCGRSLPGAVGLQGSGRGADFSDRVQTRFRRKIDELTGGDLSAPIVAYCANSERFTGYNLILRLVALGYKQVFWYRGGWEAWQVAGLPDTPLVLQTWATA